MRSRQELLKTASNLTAFTDKIKQAQEGMPGQTLTPEAVADIAMEIQQVAEVASQLATEIAEGVPAEQAAPGLGERGVEPESETDQISMAQDGKPGEEDSEKKKLKEQIANMTNDLNQIKRASLLEKLAVKYASLFPKSMHEAKMNEILTAKDDMSIITARVQEASDIITNKTMIKVASMSDSIYDFTNDENGGEIDISSKL